MLRRQLLQAAGIDLPFSELPDIASAGADDVLDAAAAAWSAQRHATGQSRSLPDAIPGDPSESGGVIWY